MKGRLLPLLFGSMVLVGAALVSVPLLVDREGTSGASAGDPAETELADPRDPYGAHRFSRVLESASGVLYGIARDEGLLVSYDRGSSWVSRSPGLPQKLIYPFTEPRPRELTALALDRERPGRIAVTTPRELWVSEDGGSSWSTIATEKPGGAAEGWPASSDHFTAVAFDPQNPDGYLLGTSFGGFYATSDGGRSWSDPSRSAEFLRRGAGMYEEVAAIAWAPAGVAPADALVAATTAGALAVNRSLIVAEGFGGRLMLWNPLTRLAVDLGFPGASSGELIHAVWLLGDGAEAHVVVSTDRSIWSSSLAELDWSRTDHSFLSSQPPAEPDESRKARMRKAANKTAIYLNSVQASEKYLDRHLDFVTRHGLNAIVVDCKEDYGYLTYDSELALPKRLGALKPRFDIETLVSKAHAKGVYVIARVLVFKDRVMYLADGSAHAVWNRFTDSPWANLLSYEDEETGESGVYQREHWTDPFDSFVWDYNIDIARELEARGVDEIQFDYIRFPTDGDLSAALYRHRESGMTNADALESFLAKARRAIRIPISTDLYGFNSWSHMATTNGQDIVMFSRYVDVIAPMFYPNHFPLGFMRDVPWLDRAGMIYLQGVRRAQEMVGANSIIRPYVQAFLLRNLAPEQNLSVAEAGVLLARQLEASGQAHASGFTLWNASNDYYMVTSSLAPYLPGR